MNIFDSLIIEPIDGIVTDSYMEYIRELCLMYFALGMLCCLIVIGISVFVIDRIKIKE